ncbi:MAG: CDP-glucose 4,6-dehydratase [Candidatus Hodarchaeota archaeon]
MGINKLFGNFFQEKKILITGHTGFIGSWLSILLNELGANLIGYALPARTQKDNFVVANLEKKMVNIIGDIRNLEELNKVFKKYKPEIVFHLAAQPLVRRSYMNPKETYDTNIGGTVNVFESFRNTTSCKLMINCTTDKVYENQELSRGYNENDRLGGYDPYSSSKACSELITSSYRNSFFNSKTISEHKLVSSVRCGNVIGGGDWQEDRIIPDSIRAIKNNQEIFIRNPSYVRPWQYVLEPIRGFLILTIKMWQEDKEYIGAWNFGPYEHNFFSVKDLVEKVIKYYGKGKYYTQSPTEMNNFHETTLLLLDNSKAYKYLGWKPEISIDETVKYLCDWYKEESIDYDFDVELINDYFKKINKNKD